ncbi:hypothetical protein ACIQM0_30515 [Streptomyces sp. NPDC091387]|uniref:hypothetical protein n=1 Tax=Streptomyces sp. NPDC091387 TaxID=3365998 RepID=UPI00382CC6FF
MHSDTAVDREPAVPGRRRKHARTARTEAPEGPVFVDSSGRRARLLRRAGIALGIACAGYTAVLGLSFMGGISLSPSALLPLDGAPATPGGPGGDIPPGSGTGAPPTPEAAPR